MSAECNLYQVSMVVTFTLDAEAALVLANTIHGPGAHRGLRARADDPPHDHLTDAADARAFLADHEIVVPATDPGPAHLGRLRRIRAAIRTLAEPGDFDLAAWDTGIDALLADATYRYSAVGRVRSARLGWDAIADDLLPAAQVLAQDRSRLRACGNPSCRFLFIDRSRNHSRVWCEMAVCGNRMKVGRHRARPVAQPPR
jgi:predicted RNA-binding Zn ribbon-like protein